MALDLYVGTLSRFATHRWEGADRRGAKMELAAGAPPPGHTVPPRPTAGANARTVVAIISRWRGAVAQAGETMNWSEDPGRPFFTDRPGWEAYTSLLLFTVYSIEAEPPPTYALERSWLEDPRLRRAIEQGSPYDQILRPSVWLPSSLELCVPGPSFDGDGTFIGTSGALLAALGRLNTATFGANERRIAAWHLEEVDGKTRLERGAQFAFAVLHEMATRAQRERLPMLLTHG